MKRLDLYLLIPALLINAMSLWIFFHGSPQLFTRQALFTVAGLILMILVTSVHHLVWIRISHLFYGLNLILLLLVLMAGREIHGARSWFHLGPVNLQPSEGLKIVLCLILVPILIRRERFRSWMPLAVVLPPLVLIIFQPDLGSAASLSAILLMAYFLSPMPLRKIFYALAGLAGIVLLSWFFLLKPYQKQRVLTFFFPERAPANYRYQVQQSLIAIGSGRITGRGFESSTQGQLRFLPAQYTDFIVAVFAEQRGFIGIAVLLLLYFFILFRGLLVSLQAGESEGALLVCLILAFFIFHVVYNIAMVAAMVPITGIPLPFMSYGGSFLVTCYIGLGLMMNVSAHRFGAQ
ncbi:MAG TPA: FtsW/RodA/SpoVE family cell cycle protein [Thermoanaerobaculia bacterium]|nr:FtsW/RodA/SpoVE family cell cycle protein [Thermoanaerobaculia bacterium]HUM30521.1 FtsW/RodA/SpoVE family cell cycle protein [Thermoanaerobaculia bacterium]HXK68713.1 FtsW/RodA/SpoVE family cell cycle protein [Thermoanaerobaculia bacterium]